MITGRVTGGHGCSERHKVVARVMRDMPQAAGIWINEITLQLHAHDAEELNLRIFK